MKCSLDIRYNLICICTYPLDSIPSLLLIYKLGALHVAASNQFRTDDPVSTVDWQAPQFENYPNALSTEIYFYLNSTFLLGFIPEIFSTPALTSTLIFPGEPDPVSNPNWHETDATKHGYWSFPFRGPTSSRRSSQFIRLARPGD